MSCLLKKCLNEVISCCIININRLFARLHGPCMMHNFHQITCRHVNILHIHGLQKENLYVTNATSKHNNQQQLNNQLEQKETHYFNIFPPLRITKVPKGKPIINS